MRAAVETAEVAAAAEVEAEAAIAQEEASRARERAVELESLRLANSLSSAPRVQTEQAAGADIPLDVARSETARLVERSAELRAAAELARYVADDAAEAVRLYDAASIEVAKRDEHLRRVRVFFVRHAMLVKEESAREHAERAGQAAASVAVSLTSESLRATTLSCAAHASEAQAEQPVTLAADAQHTASQALRSALLAAAQCEERRNALMARGSADRSTVPSIAAEATTACEQAAACTLQKRTAFDAAKAQADSVAFDAKAKWELWAEADKRANAAAASARQSKVAAVVAKHEENAASIAAAKEAAIMAEVGAIYDELESSAVSGLASTLAQQLALGQGAVAQSILDEMLVSAVAEVVHRIAFEAIVIEYPSERLLAKLITDEIFEVTAECVMHERLHGYQVGDCIYYCGHNEKRYSLLHGAEGHVLSVIEPHVLHPPGGERLLCAFGHHTAGIVCELSTLSRTRPPPLPGGYRAGEEVMFLGRSTLRCDGTLLRGAKGEVIGPARFTRPHDRVDQMLAVRFQESDREWRNCYVSAIGRRMEAELPPAGTPLRDSINRTGSRKF